MAHALFPNDGNNGSATVGLGFILDSGGEIEIIQDGDLTLIREVGSNDKVLIFDSVTGLLRDQIIAGYNGAYCYSDQQTDWGCDFGENCVRFRNFLKDWIPVITDNVRYGIHHIMDNVPFLDDIDNNILGIAGGIGISVGIACLPVFPVGTAVGALMIGGGIFANYYSNDLNKGWNYERGFSFGVDVALSSIPVAGTELKSGSVLGKVVISEGGADLSVVKLSSKKLSPVMKSYLEKSATESSSFMVGKSYKYSFTKFGTIESIVKTAYNGVDKYDVLTDFGQNYLMGLFADNVIYNIFN